MKTKIIENICYQAILNEKRVLLSESTALKLSLYSPRIIQVIDRRVLSNDQYEVVMRLEHQLGLR